jgi:hypothetical protein
MTPQPSSNRAGWLALVAVLALPYVARATEADPAAPAVLQDEIGVLRLFDEFVSAGAAASRCATPDDEAAARFLSNFQWVASHATREIGRQLPASSGDEVAAELARRSKAVKDRTHALVRSEGCEAEKVQELVRRFAVQASWRRES